MQITNQLNKGDHSPSQFPEKIYENCEVNNQSNTSRKQKDKNKIIRKRIK